MRLLPWLSLLAPPLLLLFPAALQAQFPRLCTTPKALKERKCCPKWRGSPCGMQLGRGACYSYRMFFFRTAYIDYREDWPYAFYDSVCKCNGNFDGFDCSQCKPGFKGPRCQQTFSVVRKEITSLTAEEKSRFFTALEKAKRTNSEKYVILESNDTRIAGKYEFKNATVYDQYIWLHYYAAKPYRNSTRNAAHEGPAFPFWHRVFLLFIEREIRELTDDDSFFIPYWDWTKTDHCNLCTKGYFGVSDENGHIRRESPLSRWKTLCSYDDDSLGIICLPRNRNAPLQPIIRKPGKDVKYPLLPTASDVRYTLAAEKFDTPPYDGGAKLSFRSRLEGFEVPQDSRHLLYSMHNLVHLYLNGTMSSVPISANDPLFMVHHAFIDMILEEWLQGHPGAEYPRDERIPLAQRADSYMTPFFPLRRNDDYLHNSMSDLGYSYGL
ncbi:tyrosinase [Amia ocellicauda]|uniref:tyrosinase n=1 Tax=Amia ocellicauda TaxID=2972642 RepID=UPI003464407C